MFRAVPAFMKRRPLATQVILSTAFATVGDQQDQRRNMKPGDKWDVRRSLAFLSFGLANGCFSYWFYVTACSRIVRDLSSQLPSRQH